MTKMIALAPPLLRHAVPFLLCSVTFVFLPASGGQAQSSHSTSSQQTPASPAASIPFNKGVGRAIAGREVFRFETFGNESFWTDAMHDGSVKGLDALLDSNRGPDAPHPFYVAKSDQRANMVAFLRGLDTGR
jgi:hypothetical protein